MDFPTAAFFSHLLTRLRSSTRNKSPLSAPSFLCIIGMNSGLKVITV